MVITNSRVWINRVRLPILPMVSSQENMIFPCPRSRLRIWSLETGWTVSSRASLLILHTPAEYGAYSLDYSSRVHLFVIPSTAIGSVPSISRHAITYEGVHCRESTGTGQVVLKVVPVPGVAFSGIIMDQLLCASLLQHLPLVQAVDMSCMFDTESIGGGKGVLNLHRDKPKKTA